MYTTIESKSFIFKFFLFRTKHKIVVNKTIKALHIKFSIENPKTNPATKKEKPSKYILYPIKERDEYNPYLKGFKLPLIFAKNKSAKIKDKPIAFTPIIKNLLFVVSFKTIACIKTPKTF